MEKAIKARGFICQLSQHMHCCGMLKRPEHPAAQSISDWDHACGPVDLRDPLRGAEVMLLGPWPCMQDGMPWPGPSTQTAHTKPCVYVLAPPAQTRCMLRLEVADPLPQAC